MPHKTIDPKRTALLDRCDKLRGDFERSPSGVSYLPVHPAAHWLSRSLRHSQSGISLPNKR